VIFCLFSLAGYPLHSPVSPTLPLPCVTVCHQVSILLYQTNTRRHIPEGSSLHSHSENFETHKRKPNQCRDERSRRSMLRRRQIVYNFAGLLEGSSDSRTSADVAISTAYRRQARSLHCQRDRFRETRAERGGTVL
jgi:hypothetical protein